MVNEFQANAVTKVNGFVIKMKADPIREKLDVSTVRIACGTEIDRQAFDYHNPADVSAAFSKYSMSITWAVTTDLNECENTVANGM